MADRHQTIDRATHLEGRDLDYAVITAQGWTRAPRPAHWKCEATFAFVRNGDDLCPTCSVPHYSEPYEAEKVMEIIESEKIRLDYSDNLKLWAARMDNTTTTVSALGETATLAALRCFVASKEPR